MAKLTKTVFFVVFVFLFMCMLLTGSPSTTSPLVFRITMTNWAWKVMISTGPWSIIFPMASWRGKYIYSLLSQQMRCLHKVKNEQRLLTLAYNFTCFLTTLTFAWHGCRLVLLFWIFSNFVWADHSNHKLLQSKQLLCIIKAPNWLSVSITAILL